MYFIFYLFLQKCVYYNNLKYIESNIIILIQQYTSQTFIDFIPGYNKNNKINNFEKQNEQNLINDINKLNKELENYKNENNKLKNELTKAKKVIESLQNNKKENSNIKVLQDENKNLKNQLYLKENEINQLKLKIKNNKNKFVNFDDVMVINFESKDSSIREGINCLETDTFAEVEERLYQKYDEFRNTNNMFTFNGKTILRFKNLKENNIRNGDKVILLKIE